MTSYKLPIFAIAALAVVFCYAPSEVSARIKCWKNREGVQECGNFIPQEYAQQAHKEINEHGIVVREAARAKTPQEIEKEQKEQERLAAEQAERTRLAKEQAAKDRVLLDTFTTEEDLELARAGKLQALDSRIQHTQRHVVRLKETLAKMHAEAAAQERSGQPVSKKLRKEIAAMLKQIEDNTRSIQERRKEQEAVRAKFDADLKRFRELKGRGA